MRKFSLPKFLWPWVMSHVISWAAVATLVTAFDLPDVSINSLFWHSLLISGVFSLVMTRSSRWWIPVLLEIGFFLLILHASNKLSAPLLSSAESVIHRISVAFNRTYLWGVIHWSDAPPTASVFPALLLVTGLLCLVVSQTVCHRNRTSAAVLLTGIPLLLCMVARDTVPDSWCVWLLFAGIGLLLLTGSARRMDARAGRRFTALALIPTVLATTVLFWIIPPSGYATGGLSNELIAWVQSLPFWPTASSGSNSFSGDAALPEVNLSNLGSRVDTPSVAMSVTVTRSGRLYLRGRCYDQYDGKTWTATVDSTGKDPGWASPQDGYLYTVTVTMEKPRDLLYFPGTPGVDLQDKVFMKGYLPNHGDLLEYSFSYGVPQPYNSGDLKDSGWLALPGTTKLRASAILETVLQGVDPSDTPAVVDAIEAYVEGCAEYSYVPSRMPESETDFALWFLEDADYGYCVHYATAATVLLRAAGIPARYATGYCLDVVSRQQTDVWERYAHAWVEYFLPGTGWTILDATKGSPEPDPLPTEPPEPTDPIDTSAPTEVTETSPEETQQGATSPQETAGGSTQPLTRPTATQPAVQTPTGGMPPWVKTAVCWLLLLAGALVLLIGQYRLRIWARRRHLSLGGPNRRALRRYQLIRVRSRLLKKTIPERMTQLAEKAKFSQHILSLAELQEMDGHLASLAGELTRNSRLLRFLFAIE